VHLLAIKSISGEYLHYAGQQQELLVQRVMMGGTEFLYVCHDSVVETFTARGPLIEPLVVEVCVFIELASPVCCK